MKKTIVTTLIATVLALAMTITTYAAGSIVGAFDMANASAENADLELKKAEGNVTYAQDVQVVVDAINDAHKDHTLKDAIGSFVSAEINRYYMGDIHERNVDLSKYKFLTPVMELELKNVTPSFDSPVMVTFVQPSLTDDIDADVLHYCAEHGWEILTGVENGMELEAEFHSLSPVVIIYRDKQRPSGGGWTSPSFWPTATPAPTATAAPGVKPVVKDDVVVEESDVYEESSEESVVESVVESSEESVVSSSEESDVPAGAEAEGSGSVLPIVLVAAALVAIGIFLIIFLKRKKDEE